MSEPTVAGDFSGRLAQLEEIASRLSKSSELAMALFANYPDAVVVVNGNTGEIVMANRQAEFLFGRRVVELQSMKVEDLMPIERRDRHKNHRKLYMREPATRAMGVDLNTVILTKYGEEIPVFISLAPVVLPEGMFVTVALRSKEKWGWTSVPSEIEANEARKDDDNGSDSRY